MFKNKYLIILLLMIIGIFIIYLAGQWEVGQKVSTKIEVKLYFTTRDAMHLKAEVREVEKDELYKNTLEELIKGPSVPSLSKTIPEGTRLIGISVKNGVAYPDFNKALIENHWGGSTGEVMTIYSIVNTLTQFSEVNKVQLLIEGKEIETLAGHMYIQEPLEPSEELILEGE